MQFTHLFKAHTTRTAPPQKICSQQHFARSQTAVLARLLTTTRRCTGNSMESASAATQQLQQQHNTSNKLSVPDALLQMQQAVRSGEMQQAAQIGATATIPLSVQLDELSLLGELASGAEATVLYGSFGGQDVAVKRFKISQSEDLKRFRRELSILASLAGHPNIVPVVAARALPPDYLLVMPLAATTLHAKLYQIGWRPSAVELLSLALQAAEGLSAVHAAGLVHRDIKPSNLLLTGHEGQQLWLADFGLAASAEEVVQESTLSVGMVRSRGKPTGGFMRRAIQGTLEYMAPEVLLKRPSSPASDVYALAIAINELATGVYPFSDCTKDNPDVHTVLEHGYGRQELASAVAAEGLRPTLPSQHSGVPAGLLQLLQSAWCLDPQQRPTAQQMRDALAELLQQAQQQQADAGAVSASKKQRVSDDSVSFVTDSTCFSPTAMEVDQQAAAVQPGATAGAGAVEQPVYFNSTLLQQQQQQRAGAAYGSVLSSCDSELDLQQLDSDTVISEATASLQPSAAAPAAFGGSSSNLTTQHGNRQQGPVRRPPCKSCSSLSTVSADPTTTLTSNRAPMSAEAANAAAAAAAAAAVPAADSLRGVLSVAAAASKLSQEQQRVEAGAFSALGPRESNEDRHVVVQGLGGDADVTLAAVFDGHRGSEVAAYAAAQLPRHLLVASVQLGGGGSSASGPSASPPTPSSSSSSSSNSNSVVEEPVADSSSGPSQALQQAFLATDAGFWQTWQAEMHANATVGHYAERYPGCTALAAVVAGTQLFVANAGDGRAVLSRGGTAIPLSRQHTADLEDERTRVVAAGGTVQYRGGSWRVGPAALQVTRALGDFDLKRAAQQQQQQPQQHPYQQQQPYSVSACSSCSSGGSGAGLAVTPATAMPVTAEPEVVSLQLHSSDQFLVLGTDGLWDVISDQEAVGLVQDTVKDPALCAKRLVQEALARGSKDNVTAVVVFLQPKHTLERVWLGSSGGPVPNATPTFFGSRRQTTAALQQQSDAEAGVEQGSAGGGLGVADEMMDTY